MVFETDKQAQYGDMKAMAVIIRHFQGQFTLPADLAGTPTLTVPCGTSDTGRPYTFQLLGSGERECYSNGCSKNDKPEKL